MGCSILLADVRLELDDSGDPRRIGLRGRVPDEPGAEDAECGVEGGAGEEVAIQNRRDDAQFPAAGK